MSQFKSCIIVLKPTSYFLSFVSEQLPASIHITATSAADGYYAVPPPRADYIITKYLPKSWLTAEDSIEGEIFNHLALFVEYRNRWGLEMMYSGSETSRWYPVMWNIRQPIPVTGKHYIILLNGNLRAFSGDLTYSNNKFLFSVWYPSPDRLGLDGSDIMRFLDQSAIPFIRRNIRVPYKLDFTSRLRALEFIAQTQAEWNKVRTLIITAQQRFGGKAFVFESPNEP